MGPRGMRMGSGQGSTIRVIKSRRLRWVGHVVRIEEGRSLFKILTGGSKCKIPSGRPRRRWEDNFKMYIEIGRAHV